MQSHSTFPLLKATLCSSFVLKPEQSKPLEHAATEHCVCLCASYPATYVCCMMVQRWCRAAGRRPLCKSSRAGPWEPASGPSSQCATPAALAASLHFETPYGKP